MSNAMDHHVEALADLMRRRTPPPDVTADQLRARNWWSGPTVYVIVDDYDLVSTSSGNPLAPLTELLPFARDVGIRFIVARNTAGAGRSGPRRLPGSSELGSVDVCGEPQKQANTAPVDHGVLYASRSTKVPCSFHHHLPPLLPLAPHPVCRPCVRAPRRIKSAAWSRSSIRSPIRAEPAACATGSPPSWPWSSVR